MTAQSTAARAASYVPSLISDIVSIAYSPASARIVAGRRSARRRAANGPVANRYGTTCGWPGSSR